MRMDELVTVEILNQHQNLLLKKIEELENKLTLIHPINKNNYLRTVGVKKLLKVSDNKLKTMRESGEIPFSFIGSTYYYPEDEIIQILKKNTINKN
jgi:hypothetical protein